MYNCIQKVQGFLTELKNLADSVDEIKINDSYKIFFQQTNTIESYNGINSRVGNDPTKITKSPKEHSHARERCRLRLYRFKCEADYSPYHICRQIYNSRVVYYKKVNKEYAKKIYQHFKDGRINYNKIKIRLEIIRVIRHPAVMLFIYTHHRERATQMRASKKKPIGFGSHNCRRKALTILHYDEYFPQIPVERRGVSIQNHRYIVQFNSIILTMIKNTNTIGYLCSTTMLHESCYLDQYVF